MYQPPQISYKFRNPTTSSGTVIIKSKRGASASHGREIETHGDMNGMTNWCRLNLSIGMEIKIKINR
jgi:hypothetical protein